MAILGAGGVLPAKRAKNIFPVKATPDSLMRHKI